MPSGVYWRPTAHQRFWSYVPSLPEDQCWEWKGGRRADGYGYLKIGREMFPAHRLMLMLATGSPLQVGEFACHSCDNKSCVNPAHLHVGTNQSNQLEFVERHAHREAIKTHCSNGHPFNEENTYIWGRKKKRICRLCRKMHEQNKRNELKRIYGNTYHRKVNSHLPSA